MKWTIAVAAAFAAAILIASAACRKTTSAPAPSPSSRGWDVYDGKGKLVEWIDDEPGPLVSAAAPPPPGAALPRSAFATVTSKDVWSEDSLERLLERSSSFDGYVRLLERNGYKVVPSTAGDSAAP